MQNLVVVAAALVLLLQPVQCLKIPGNLQLGDFASLLFLPLVLTWCLRTQRAMRLPFAGPMLAILAITAVATLATNSPWAVARSPVSASQGPLAGAIVLVTESYLYLWFAALALVFSHVDERNLRRLLWAWVLSGVGNGALILLQFVQPSVLSSMNAMLGSRGALDPFRPSGLFENCNSASLFQLSCFVPLVLLRLKERTTAALTAVLLAMMMGTGSMGGAMAFAAGTAVCMAGLVLVRNDSRAFLRYVALGAVGIVLLAMLVALLLTVVPDLQQRVQYIITGRGEGSANSRFGLWRQGIDILLRDLPLFGVGPDMFKTIAGFGLHNDFLSFSVERGPFAVLALGAMFTNAAVHAVQIARDRSKEAGNAALVHLGMLAALLTVSLTHEIFHQRPIWVALAVQEAMWWRMLRRQAQGAGIAAGEPGPTEPGPADPVPEGGAGAPTA